MSPTEDTTLPRREELHPFGALMNDYFAYAVDNDHCTRWKWARFHVEPNFEALFPPLQQDIRFFHPPIPAPPWAFLTVSLPC
jgi:hypothetical protein